MRRRIQLLSLCVMCMAVLMSARRDKPASMVGKEVPAFSLLNTTGKMVALADYKDAKGFIIVFTCNHCPFAKLYSQRLNKLNTTYTIKGVPLIAVNPMDSLVYEEETFKGMQEWAASQHYTFPYLQDGSQQVVKAYNALHTPQAYVIWKEQDKWVVKYSGAIDDNGQHPELAKPFVANAVNDLLHGKQPKEAETFSLGCEINFR